MQILYMPTQICSLLKSMKTGINTNISQLINREVTDALVYSDEHFAVN